MINEVPFSVLFGGGRAQLWEPVWTLSRPRPAGSRVAHAW